MLGTEHNDSISSNIRQVFEEAQPSTVRELVHLVKTRYPKLTIDQIVVETRSLSLKGGLVLFPPRFTSFPAFLRDFRWNSSFWMVLFTGILATISFLAINGPPWSLLRLPMVVLILFYFSGHSFLRIISPRSDFTLLERTLLDFATSIVIVFLVGLFLNFSHLGFFALPSISSMFVLDIILATAASYQYYSTVRSMSQYLRQ
jgi:Protein of unknown function (DUF1616)